jgi:hypothetical protein
MLILFWLVEEAFLISHVSLKRKIKEKKDIEPTSTHEKDKSIGMRLSPRQTMYVSDAEAFPSYSQRPDEKKRYI